MKSMVNELIDFIDSSVSSYHAIDGLKRMLTAAGFVELHESDEWHLSAGHSYYVTRNLSSVIAFKLPSIKPLGFMIAAAHSDSPCFKLKKNFELEANGYIRINAERYGGAIYSSWLDRPLSVAGRLTVSDKNSVKSRLVSLDDDVMLIPNAAIHMNRAMNDGYAYNPAVDLVPLYSSTSGKGGLLKAIASAAEISESDILDFDLFVFNRQKGTVWGYGGEYFSAPRIDDLQCAYSTVRALIESEPTCALPVAAVFDNEEVGSATKQGADSSFLYDVLSRLSDYIGSKLPCLLPSSLMLSADNAHALHPNHPEYADNGNRPMMNGGVVIKYNANQRYTSDGVSAAMFSKICTDADVPLQFFANRSDMAGGSTLGNISNTHVSLNTVDIGCAQLAMHSAYETAGSRDTDHMLAAMRAFYSSAVKCERDGEYSLL